MENSREAEPRQTDRTSAEEHCEQARLGGASLVSMFGLFAGARLRPELSGQREFSMIQGRRLPDHEFHHLDVLIDLAE